MGTNKSVLSRKFCLLPSYLHSINVLPLLLSPDEIRLHHKCVLVTVCDNEIFSPDLNPFQPFSVPCSTVCENEVEKFAPSSGSLRHPFEIW